MVSPFPDMCHVLYCIESRVHCKLLGGPGLFRLWRFCGAVPEGWADMMHDDSRSVGVCFIGFNFSKLGGPVAGLLLDQQIKQNK